MNNGLQSCLQIFPSSKMSETKVFYEKLGFRAQCYLESSQPHICLYKDSVEFILTQSNQSQIIPVREQHGYGYDAYIISAAQEYFYNIIKNNHVPIIKELNLTDYNNREFIFEDNERRWIAVGCKEDSDVIEGMCLNHIAFICRNIRETEKFYTDILGLKRERIFNEGEENEFFILGRDGFRIELFSGKNDVSAGDVKFKHFAVEVKSLDNVMNSLQHKGVVIDRFIDYSTKSNIFKICFIKDPEGNVIEFMEGYSGLL